MWPKKSRKKKLSWIDNWEKTATTTMKMNQKKEKKITNKANKKRYTESESSYDNRAYVNKKDIFFYVHRKKKCHKGNEKNLPSTCDKKDFGSAYLTDL